MRITLLIVLLLALAGCVLPPSVPYVSSPSPVRDSAVGCWRLESSFSNGFGGTVVRATIRGHRHRGRGPTWADVEVLAIRGPVHGERVPCSTEPAP